MDRSDFEEFASSRGTTFAREAYLICSGDRAAAEDAVQERGGAHQGIYPVGDRPCIASASDFGIAKTETAPL